MADSFKGVFEPCPNTPNCVSSQADPADEEHYLPAIAYAGDKDALALAAEVLSAQARTTITSQSATYLKAEARSRVFRFVDDIEVFFDRAQGYLHFRSAARLGRSDLGVNRRRMQAFSAALRRKLE